MPCQEVCITGTAAYMSPEQANDPCASDFRADIYSLGACLYHAITGRLPFEALDLGSHRQTLPTTCRFTQKVRSWTIRRMLQCRDVHVGQETRGSFSLLRRASGGIGRAVGDPSRPTSSGRRPFLGLRGCQLKRAAPAPSRAPDVSSPRTTASKWASGLLDLWSAEHGTRRSGRSTMWRGDGVDHIATTNRPCTAYRWSPSASWTLS